MAKEVDKESAVCEAWRLVQNESYNRSNWCYNGASLDDFYNVLTALEIRLPVFGVCIADVRNARLFGHLNAARECWRLSFKNDSMHSPSSRLQKMDVHLEAVSKTRADIGLFETSMTLVQQVPDIQMALMNPGRLTYVHHLWQPGGDPYLVVFDYDIEAQVFSIRE